MADTAHVFRADCHLHTSDSFDARDDVHTMCRGAMDRSVDLIAVTDHCDIEFRGAKHFLERQENSFRHAREAADRYRGKLEVLCGVELGQAIQDVSFSRELIGRFPYDFVIMSLHSMRGKPDFCDMPREMMEQQGPQLLEQYFTEVLELARLGIGDALAHLTYPIRYFAEHRVAWDLHPYEEQIRLIFRTLAQAGIPLECNTSGLRQKLGEPFPSRDLLTLYYQEGGRLISLGSDCHRHEDIYAGIDSTREMLRELGFVHGAYFRGRKLQTYSL